MQQSKSNVGKVLIISLVVAIALGVAAFFAIDTIGTSAAQAERSEHVSLVVNQLQSRPASEGDRGMASILIAADSSETQYWILECDGAVLFSKNAAETNAYRGLPVSGHPVAAQAQELIASAREGETSHASITVGEDGYLVSATKFAYDGILYTLCLVTAQSAIGGEPLSASQVPLYALVATVLVLVVAIPTLIAAHAARKRSRVAAPPNPTGDAPAPDSSSAPTGDTPVGARPARPRPQGAQTTPDPDDPSPGSPVGARPARPRPQGAQTTPDPENAAQTPLPARSADELEPYLSSMVSAGVDSTYLARVSCADSDAMLAFRRSAAASQDAVLACFDMGDSSLVLALASATADDARDLLAPHLSDGASIVTVVPLFEP